MGLMADEKSERVLAKVAHGRNDVMHFGNRDVELELGRWRQQFVEPT